MAYPYHETADGAMESMGRTVFVAAVIFLVSIGFILGWALHSLIR